MATIGSLFIEVQSDNAKLDKSLKKSTGLFDGFGKKIETVAKTALLAGSAAFVALGVKATKMAMDAVESENLFTVSMGKMAAAARSWSEELSKSLGLNEYELRKQISTFTVMFDSMGLGTEKAYEMSAGLTELAYDMASFYNLRPEEAFEKLQAGITGEIEPLKRLGILVNENTVKTVAYSKGIAEQGKQLTEQEKVLARYAAIMDQTSKAQGDLGRTLDSPTNALRIIRTRIEELTTKLGMAFLPALASVLDVIGQFVLGLGATGIQLQKLATIVAAPIGIFYKMMSALHKLNAVLYGWAFGFLEVIYKIAEAAEKLPFAGKLGIKAEPIRSAMREMLVLQNANYTSAREWQEKLTKLDESLNMFGNEVEVTTPKINVNTAAIDDNKKAADELKKIIDDFPQTYAEFVSSSQSSLAEIRFQSDAYYELGESIKDMKGDMEALPTEPLNRTADELVKTATAGENLNAVMGESKEVVSELGRQISTIWTDFSRDIADAIVEWKGFWEALKNVGKSLAKAFLRTLTEALFTPLENLFKKVVNGIISNVFDPLINSITGKLTSVFSGGISGGGASGGASGALGSTGLLGSVISGGISGTITALADAFSNKGEHLRGIEEHTRYTALIAQAIADKQDEHRDIFWQLEANTSDTFGSVESLKWKMVEKIDAIIARLGVTQKTPTPEVNVYLDTEEIPITRVITRNIETNREGITTMLRGAVSNTVGVIA